MGIFKNKFNKTPKVSKKSVRQVVTKTSVPRSVAISGDLKFPTAAVGEDYTKDAIRGLLAKHAMPKDLELGRLVIEGVVRPEPTNQYDPDALIVLIDGVKVGYVSASRTSSFRHGVLRIMEEKSGMRASIGSDWIAEFTMRIGWVPTEKYPQYGVTIDTPAGFYNP
ncbi:MAG: hypothetical protein Q7R42_06015 [Candidatus Planktophila sp.]|nr:hypothetical protein [Candidatus Planktophila sp.]